MITLTRVIVKSFSLEYLDVSWEISDEPVDLSTIRFTVTRSESPEGPFEAVSPPLTDKYSFRDKTVDLISKLRTFYYQIKVTKPGEPGFVPLLSPISYLGTAPDYEAVELHRLEELELRVHTGRPVVVLKKRTFGPPCPDCFDDLSQRKTKSDCKTCFASRYRGGFMSPISVLANFSPSNKILRLANFAQLSPSESVVVFAGYPLLLPTDVLIEETNRRWRVQDVRHRSLRRFVFKQIVRVTEIPRTDVVFKYGIADALFVVDEDIGIFRPDNELPVPHAGVEMTGHSVTPVGDDEI